MPLSRSQIWKPYPYRFWPRDEDGNESKGANQKQKLLWIERMPLAAPEGLSEEELKLYPVRPHQHDKDIVLALGGTRSGKCWKKNTPILMFDGRIKFVQNIQVGDKVMGPDSTPRVVTSLARGREEMFEVIPIKGKSFTCNASHILSLKRSGRCHGKVVNISVRDYLKSSTRLKKTHKLYRADEITFPERGAPSIDPYFIGLWLGDGTKSTAAITNPEPEIKKYLKQTAKRYDLKLRVQYQKATDCPTFFLSSGNESDEVCKKDKNPIHSVLRNYNLLGNKHIPKDFKLGSLEDRKQLLAGLIDSDGHLQAGCVDLIQKNKRLAKDITFLCRSLGLAAYMQECRKGCLYKGEMKMGTYYRISISGDLSKIPCKVARKQASPRERNSSVLVTGFSVESRGEGEYFGFSVDGPDNLLLMGDFTVTHNTTGVVARILYLCKMYPGAQFIVGSMNFKHLEKTVILDYQELMSDKEPWDHPAIIQKPDRNHKHLLLSNGPGKRHSMIRFVNFSEKKGENILGERCDGVHIEEPELLYHGETTLDVALTRLSNHACPIKQVFLTANPTANLKWIRNRFTLKQFTEGYDGDPIPIGNPCECQFCFDCRTILKGQKKVLWENGSCPRCGKVKKTKCPGNQHYQRVIISSPADNLDYLPETYGVDLETTLGKDAAKKFSAGIITLDAGGRCYPRFSEMGNLADGDEIDDCVLNPEEEITWALDLNQRPQASILYQKDRIDGIDFMKVFDEFAIWDADAIDVANAFVERYSYLLREGFENFINLRGDPMMHGGVILRNGDYKDKDKFEHIAKILRKAGFKVRILTPSTKYPIKDRITTANHNFKDENGICRIRINPKCVWLIKSAEETIWNKGETEESKTIDNLCTNKGKAGEIWGTTHHMAALGYASLEDFPMIRKLEKTQYFVTSSGAVIYPDKNGKLVERHRGELPEEDEEDYDEEDEDDEEEDEEPRVIRRPSLAEQLSMRGGWGLRRS